MQEAFILGTGTGERLAHEEVGGVRHRGFEGPGADKVAREAGRRLVEQHAGRQSPVRIPCIQQTQARGQGKHPFGARKELPNVVREPGPGGELRPQAAVRAHEFTAHLHA